MEKRPISEKAIQDNKFLNALAEAFRLQEAILNATDLAIVSTTPDGIITSFNKAAEKLLGYSSEELIGKANPLIFHDLEEVVKRSEKLSHETGAPIEPVFEVFTFKPKNENRSEITEWTLIRKDGTRFPATLSITPLHDDHGTLIGFAAIPTDITARKAAEEQNLISEQKFRLLAENIPGAIYLCKNDAQYSMLYLNERVEEITGYTANEFLQGNISFVDLYHPDDAASIFKKVDEALAAKKNFRLRYRLKHRSGEWRWIDESGMGVYASDELLMIEGFLCDITSQKKAEETLEKIAEENLRVFNNPVNLNAIAGFDGYFKRLSPTWSQLLGWTDQELRSKPFIEFIHPDDKDATLEVVKYIEAGNNLFTFENRYYCKDGSYRWLLWGSAPDIANKIIYASAIDITERKKSEEELVNSKKSLETIAGKLQKQNRQLDEFAHIISHNLRSPVGNIQALINLLNDNSTIGEYKMIFEKLKNVAKNLGETMNDLMDTMKVKESANAERADIRFKEILDKVIQTLEGDLIHAEASVTYNFKASSVQYNKAYLESIFQNLLTNALKYRAVDRKPNIHFETVAVDHTVELRVSDNGMGIDMERFGDKLFGLHKTFHTNQEARGVGLFLIKTQVESMGGSITAESAVDRGTTFIIRF
jgi:PAS domain S-box-containing protein